MRKGARIGRSCIVGEKTYIAYDVVVGDLCKINACAYLCAGTVLEDGVMVSAHVVFTNDATPRATDPDVTALRDSAPDESTRGTRVLRGATIGANATIGPGLSIGTFAMVGMGSVVTRDVPPFALVVGNPARVVGLVDRSGRVVWRAERPGALPAPGTRIPCPDGGTLVVATDGGIGFEAG